MSRVLSGLLALGVSIALFAPHLSVNAFPAKPLYDPQQHARPKLEGLWRMTHAEFEGQDLWASNKDSQNRWLITPEKITILMKQDGVDRNCGSWTYRMDLTRSPMVLDLTPVENNPGQKVVLPCLLHVEGDRFTVCMQNFPDRGRPIDLLTRPNSGIAKFIYERVR